MEQEQIFISSEADQYFLRNKEELDLTLPDNDLAYNVLKKFDRLDEITSVLELGCATGYRLHFLKKLLPNCTKFVGMDASGLAIQHGKEKYGLELYQDSLATFSYPEKFDLVIVDFILHWIDRDLLYQCVANIDNFLKPQNSFLLLGDFFPFYPYKRKYTHTQNVYTYKIDYKQLFLSSNMYQIIDKSICVHDYLKEKITNLNRVEMVLLEKNCTGFYNSIE